MKYNISDVANLLAVAISSSASSISPDIDFTSSSAFSRPDRQIWTPETIMFQLLEQEPGVISRQISRATANALKQRDTKPKKTTKKQKAKSKAQKSHSKKGKSRSKQNKPNPEKIKSYYKYKGKAFRNALRRRGSKHKPTASGLCQARNKLTPEPFKRASGIFLDSVPDTKMISSMDSVFIAIDGTNLPIPVNFRDQNGKNVVSTKGKPRAALHVNCAVMIDGAHYVLDSVIQSFDMKNECEAALTLIKELEKRFPDKKLVFVMDRGYFNWEMVQYCCSHGHYFLVRMKKNVYINQTSSDHASAPSDEWLTKRLTNSNGKSVKEDPTGTLTYVPKDSLDLSNIPEEQRELKLRWITSALDPEVAKALKKIDAYNKKADGNQQEQKKEGKVDYRFTYLCTNLPDSEFSQEKITTRYFARWAIEISYGLLKRKVGLSWLHSKSENKIRQEIWMNLMKYNACCALVQYYSKLADKERRYKKPSEWKKPDIQLPENPGFFEPGKAPLDGNGYICKISFSTVCRCLYDYLKKYTTVEIIVDDIKQNLVFVKPGGHQPRGGTITHFEGFQHQPH